jgi:2-dehydro-3-deoxyphosphooctonate aldolase (KDO 8-P synthase)
MTTSIEIGSYRVGGSHPLLWIAGPCVIESRDHCLSVASRLRTIANQVRVPIVFKASFDKANRSSGKSFRGVGLETGLSVLSAVKREIGFPVTTDVHEASQCAPVAEVCDVLQIPAFLARQTDLLEAAGRTGRVVNVKKGQFQAPWDMKNVVAKLADVGNRRVLLCERGTTFGYGMLVNDMRAIPWMQQTGQPVIFDATHSVQTPGALGDRTGGDRSMVPVLARAAVAAGANGIFVETHPDPDQAPSDGPNMIPLAQLPDLIRSCERVRAALNDLPEPWNSHS